VARAASEANAPTGDAQEAFSLEGVPGAPELKTALVAVALEAVRALAPGFPADAQLDARLTLRRYPRWDFDIPQGGQRLGAHVDDTLCTLLWSTGPGLEVLAPDDEREWTGADVARVGLPTMGEPVRAIEPGDWAAVDLSPWDSGALLLTPGHGWPKCPATAAAVPLRSPTLHRVALGNDRERLSLPLLVSLRRTDPEGGA